MQKKNMALWESVCKTDPKNTKHVNQRGGFTAIGAQSQIKAATEQFGCIGIGWGVKNESYELIGNTLLKYQAIFWFVFDGEKGEFPIASSILIVSGDRVDDDCVKKVSTDAITKGLSRLGFNSDVFEGAFDDNKYVNTPQSKPNYNPSSTSETPGGKKLISEKQMKFIFSLMENNSLDKKWLDSYLVKNNLGDTLKEVSSINASSIIDAIKFSDGIEPTAPPEKPKPTDKLIKFAMRTWSCKYTDAVKRLNDIASDDYNISAGIEFLSEDECREIAAKLQKASKELPF